MPLDNELFLRQLADRPSEHASSAAAPAHRVAKLDRTQALLAAVTPKTLTVCL
jgi:hypothetical protein